MRFALITVSLCTIAALLSGCSPATSEAPDAGANTSEVTPPDTGPIETTTSPPAGGSSTTTGARRTDPALQPQSGDFPTLTITPKSSPSALPAMEDDPATATLGDLLAEDALDERGKLRQKFPAPPTIDADRAQAAGLRILDGRHIRLVTDLPSSPEIDALPDLFDAAVPLWAAYLDVPPATFADWKIQAYLMDREEPFRALGLLGAEDPDFRHGYQRGLEFWCRRQEDLGYYQRHLFLHEGVHAFMAYCLGGTGPPWFAEGMAEVLATHRLADDGSLTLPVMPADRDDVPLWGRTKVVRDAFAAGEAKPIDQILTFGPTAHRETETYAWSWSLCWFLANHPRSKAVFAEMPERASDFGGDFTQHLRDRLADDWAILQEDWGLLVSEFDYGYDVAANVPVRAESRALDGPRTVEVATNAGWQSTGATLQAGKSYRLSPRGTATATVDGQSWDFGPHGVTLWYFNGRPYGELHYALRGADQSIAEPSALLRPSALTEETTFTPVRDGTLYLRTNLPSSVRSRSQGEIAVDIAPVP